MRKNVKDLIKGEKFRFEVGDFGCYITMQTDKVEQKDERTYRVYGTVLATRLKITEVGKYDFVDFRDWETVEVVK